MANSKRKCGYCGERKKADSMFIVGPQAFCSRDHYIENQVKNKDKLVKKGRDIQAREERKAHKERKESLKPRSKWLKEAQMWFNKFIRLRDTNKLCISCDRTIGEIEGNDGWKPGGAWDAGHYLTRGAHPELRFEELNCHKQCKSCNAGSGKFSAKSRTVGERYREKLIDKIGLPMVEWLEGPHKEKKYTIDDLKEIIVTYKAKCKELQRETLNDFTPTAISS